MGSAARPSIRCLGAVGIFKGDSQVDLSRQQRELVGILVAAGPKGLEIDQLYNELYGTSAAKRGRQAAVMRVSRLRSKFDEDALLRGSRYGFDALTVDVDVWQFDAACSAKDYVQALSLWGEPFEDLAEPSPRIRVETERLTLLHRQILVPAGWRIGPGKDESLVRELVAELESVPYHEALTASAASALYRLGRATESLELIQQCRRGLREQHGLDVGNLLRETELAILQQDDSALGLSSDGPLPTPRHDSFRSSASSFPRSRFRFVGRKKVLADLQACLSPDEVTSDLNEMVLLEGPAGAGKTHTIAQAVATQVDQGVAVRIGISHAADDGAIDQTPYGTLLRALPELADSVADLSQAAEDGAIQATMWYRLDQILRTFAAEEPFILVLEDVHAADSQSLLALRHLASTACIDGMRLAVTARPVDTETEWTRTRHALVESGSVRVLSLLPLSPGDVRELVAQDHPEEPAIRRDRFAARVHEISKGNALVVSVLSSDAPSGLDSTLLPEAITPEIGLANHLRSRIASQDLADLLSVAALVGQEFSVALLAAISALDEGRTRELLAKAQGLSICHPISESHWQFEHMLFASFFSDRLSLLRPILFGRLARHRDAPHREVVRYVAGAGSELDPDEALVLLAAAADRLQTALAFTEATTALQLSRSLLDPGSSKYVDVLISLAACLSRSGAFVEASELRSEAWTLAKEIDDHDAMARIALAGLPSAESVQGDPDRLAMLASIDRSRVTSFSQAELASTHLRHARLCQDHALAHELSATADPDWEHVDQQGWQSLRLERLLVDASSHEGRAIRAPLAALASTTPASQLRARILFRELLASLVEQDQAAMTSVFDEVADEIETTGSYRTKWALDVVAATISEMHIDDPMPAIQRAYATGVRWGIPDALESFGVQMWMRFWFEGQFADALALAQRADQASRDARNPNLAWQAGASLCAAQLGDHQSAKRDAAAVARGLTRQPDSNWATVCAALLSETAQLLDMSMAASAAQEALLSRSGQAIVLGIGAAHFGPVDRYLGLNALTLGDATAVPLFQAAAAQASNTGVRFWADRAARDLDKAKAQHG